MGTHRSWHFKHRIHENLLQHASKATGTTSAVKTLLSDSLERSTGEDELRPIPPEQSLVLLDEGVTGLGQDANKIFHLQGVKG